MQKQHSNNGAPTARIKVIRVVAMCWLILLAGFFGGVYVSGAQIWPYPILKDIKDFIAGHKEEKTSLAEKLENDLGIKPSRHIVTDTQFNETLEERRMLGRGGSPEFRAFSQRYGKELKELKGLPINPRRKTPRIFLSKDAPRGYRVIYGVFDFQKALHGAILLDPDGNVANVWQTSQEGVKWWHGKDFNVYPHGFDIAPDGSIVTAYDGGSSLIKYNNCGKMAWAIRGGFNHSIESDHNGAIWAWGDTQGFPFNNFLMKIDYTTGKVLRKFHLDDVMEANPEIDIFGILQDYDGKWLNSDDTGFFWHANDIEALPAGLAQYYPQFRAGDLLVSLRQPDLIFVMDPETLKVKWWRQGLARRPHDPDWNDRGTITIYNNNTLRGYSNIMELDPVTMDYDIVVEGKEYQFYSTIRGKHQLEPDGSYLITSSNQGRVFEVGPKGDVTFEFLNAYGQDGSEVEYLAVSEARFLPQDYFKELPKCD
jgi:hypothetical protein